MTRWRVTAVTPHDAKVEIVEAADDTAALALAGERWLDANPVLPNGSASVVDMADDCQHVAGSRREFCFTCWLLASPVHLKVAQLLDGTDRVVPGSEVTGYIVGNGFHWI